MLLALLLGTPELRPSDAADGDAIAHLAQLVYQRPGDSPAPAAASLYQILYWMRVAAVRNDFSPDGALRAAWQRTNSTEAPGSPPSGQLLADWHIASVYGLFTADNMARLQAGVAPVATDGPFLGRTIQVVKIPSSSSLVSVEAYALAPEGQAPAKDAVATDRAPARRTVVSGQPPFVPAPYAPAAGAPFPVRGATVTIPGRPDLPGPRNLPMQSWPVPGPATAVASPRVPSEAPHILLHDLPLNALLPLEGKTKLGIAGVTSSEISVSIVGGRQVLIKAYLPGTRDTYVPSVDNYKVPRINPVRLPGISNDAYLIKDDSAGQYGTRARYYYIDVSVDNGATFRLAKVTGGF